MTATPAEAPAPMEPGAVDAGTPPPSAQQTSGVASDAPVQPSQPTTTPSSDSLLDLPDAAPADAPGAALPAWARKADNRLEGLSLAELLNTELVTPSAALETVWDSPSTVVVITSEDIRSRGYTDLPEVIADLPGFDISVANGTDYLIAYQRGYRTPLMQRTLFLINGIVDNNLWKHSAEITRQYPLSAIDRIEVVYGPASAVYGPNAFLGVINVITKNPAQLQQNGVTGTVNLHAGSWLTRAVDSTVSGKWNDVSFSLSGRLHVSEEANLSDRWGWSRAETLADPEIWGPLLTQSTENVPLGIYHDPTDDYGILGTAHYKGLTLGIIHWLKKEGYGAYYAADQAQPNVLWNSGSKQYYLQHKSEPFEKLKLDFLALYRDSSVFGDWAEATPDWNPGMEDFSYVSFTAWNSESNSALTRLNFESPLLEMFTLSGGLKYERKELTKQYDIPGYWTGSGTYSSTVSSTETGPDGQGLGVVHSSRPTYERPSPPSDDMPRDNRALTEDVGGFLQGIVTWSDFRFNGGLRYDVNSIYGDSLNPRLAAIYNVGKIGLLDRGAVKAMYGTAFQEPAPIQLWGGWTGRAANPDLEPETARNFELAFLAQSGWFFNQVSVYHARYENVIAETAENLGNRRVTGVEYTGRAVMPNPRVGWRNVTAFWNYTFTRSMSSHYYDFVLGEWLPNVEELGDIAPHKVNAGVTFPVQILDFTLKGNWVSEKKLYLRNALRDPNRPDGGRPNEGYVVLDAVATAHWGPAHLSFKVKNLLDTEYFHSGAELANAGDDFSAPRSSGFMNSLIPQPGRSFMGTLSIDL